MHWLSWCIYEGIEPEFPRSKRNKLVNPHYFSGVYGGAENAKLRDEMCAYLDSHYDMEKVKKIYLNADGRTWDQSEKRGLRGVPVYWMNSICRNIL